MSGCFGVRNPEATGLKVLHGLCGESELSCPETGTWPGPRGECVPALPYALGTQISIKPRSKDSSLGQVMPGAALHIGHFNQTAV